MNGDCDAFAPADQVDPAYGRALREAIEGGVEAYALAASIGPRQVRLHRHLSIQL